MLKRHKKRKYSAMNQKKEKIEASYFRLFVLANETLKSVTLIIDNNNMKSHGMAFWNKLRLGNIVLIVNSSFEGHFSSIPLLKCECLLPTF